MGSELIQPKLLRKSLRVYLPYILLRKTIQILHIKGRIVYLVMGSPCEFCCDYVVSIFMTFILLSPIHFHVCLQESEFNSYGESVDMSKLRIACYGHYNRGLGVAHEWIWVLAAEILAYISQKMDPPNPPFHRLGIRFRGFRRDVHIFMHRLKFG